MTTGPVGPGTVIAGRYRLDDLLAESAGARFWRATDTILARSVAIHAVPSTDPRAPGLLDAARVSATVTDPHLLRVLDCDDEGEITWVVNEWGDGISLDLMLQQGTLPPSRAAWLTREVAEAIAAGHAQGVAHGRLNPEAVLVTHAGAVKLIGYVVDASLETPRPPDPLYGELDEREADVINLAGILYAALTGRWPGVARSAVPKAPREARRPLRPRQVRAGVPRTLDAICERVLHKEGSQHAMPIETAHEIAAALADYVGDPALSAPMDAAAMHAEPPAAVPTDDPEATQLTTPIDPDATQTFRATDEGPDSLAPLHAPGNEREQPWEPAPPPAPFPDLPERPLFASTERRVPASSREQSSLTSSPWSQPDARSEAGSDAGSDAGGHPGSATSTHLGLGQGGRHGNGSGNGSENGNGHSAPPPGFWPFDQDPEEESEVHTGREGRGWLRMAIVVGVLLVLVVAMAVAFNRGREDGNTPSGSDPSPSNAAKAKAKGAALKLTDVRDFDPFATPPAENPDSAPNAIDGDPATSWTTVTYRGNPALGGLKSGVGLMVDLGSEKQPRSVSVRFKGAPTSFEVYAAPGGVTQSPEKLDQLDKVAARADAAERATVTLDPAPKTRFVLVWLTRLPAVAGGFRGEITDISVRS